MDRQPLPPQLLGSGRDLTPQQVAVNEWQILPVAIVELYAVAVGRFGGDYSLHIIDIPGATGYVIPYTREALLRLSESIDTILGDSETNGKD